MKYTFTNLGKCNKINLRYFHSNYTHKKTSFYQYAYFSFLKFMLSNLFSEIRLEL